MPSASYMRKYRQRRKRNGGEPLGRYTVPEEIKAANKKRITAEWKAKNKKRVLQYAREYYTANRDDILRHAKAVRRLRQATNPKP